MFNGKIMRNIRRQERIDARKALQGKAGFVAPPPERPSVEEVAARIWGEWPKGDPERRQFELYESRPTRRKVI